MHIFQQRHHTVNLAIRFVRQGLLSLSYSAPLMLSDNNPFLPPVSHLAIASNTLTPACKHTLGASKPDAEEDLSHHILLQERYAESPSTLRRSSSALSRTLRIEEIPTFPGPTVRSRASLGCLSPVKPLRTLRRVARNSDLSMSPPKVGSFGRTMADARELFEQHGIDRPAG